MLGCRPLADRSSAYAYKAGVPGVNSCQVGGGPDLVHCARHAGHKGVAIRQLQQALPRLKGDVCEDVAAQVTALLPQRAVLRVAQGNGRPPQDAALREGLAMLLQTHA